MAISSFSTPSAPVGSPVPRNARHLVGPDRAHGVCKPLNVNDKAVPSPDDGAEQWVAEYLAIIQVEVLVNCSDGDAGRIPPKNPSIHLNRHLSGIMNDPPARGFGSSNGVLNAHPSHAVNKDNRGRGPGVPLAVSSSKTTVDSSWAVSTVFALGGH
ncbi:hypothetical protein VTH82DRAFT_6142 [Thermothelomyces myriococcoides]